MTIHAAVNFSDEKNRDVGYLIGSDSRIDSSNHTYYFHNKSFRSNNHIGIHMGVIPGLEMEVEDWEEAHRLSKQNLPWKNILFQRALTGVFDNISEGKNYSDLPILKLMNECGGYHLLIGVKRDGKIGLYVISNDPEASELKKDTAYLLDQMANGSLESSFNSKFWFLGPGVPRVNSIIPKGYVEEEYQKCLSFEEAAMLIDNTLQLSDGEMRPLIVGYDAKYDPGPSHIYAVSFKKFGKLEGVVSSKQTK